MNEVLKAIRERRSCRKFQPDLPKRDVIDQIIEAGLYAPSGKNTQDTIIVAVTDPDLRARISRDNQRIGGFPEGFDPFYGAPVILIVLVDKSLPYRAYDGGIVMQNLMLAAHSLGLGSIWIHRAREEFELPEYQDLLKTLGVEGEWEGVGHCAIGYADCELPEPPARREGRVFYAE